MDNSKNVILFSLIPHILFGGYRAYLTGTVFMDRLGVFIAIVGGNIMIALLISIIIGRLFFWFFGKKTKNKYSFYFSRAFLFISFLLVYMVYEGSKY